MYISKKNKEIIKQKFGGKCAYTGKILSDDWQVDHMVSKIKHQYNSRLNCSSIEELNNRLKKLIT